MPTRDEHVEWCKERAREYLAHGDIKNAITSMLSDMSNHPETEGIAEKMGMMGIWIITRDDQHEAHRFIEGFR
jgi:hypothetical protein